ncbi:hypothetical protein D0N87_32540, partial [Pseudomonas sp. ATCC 13867]
DGAVEIRQVGAQVTEIQALVDAAQEVLGRDVLFQIERIEQARCPPGNCPIMLPAPTLAECAILPAASGGSYFFNRIGRSQPVAL